MSPPSINTLPGPVDVLILAAGLGTRMKSNLAKVLHKLDGRPLIGHVVRTASTLQPRKVYIVVGHQAKEVQAAVEGESGKERLGFLNQVEQRGKQG
jgi:bifunctional UDP-N-acetylglucosamine pyrophosphorylase/glucosamine-1-phosphate N-acetyltransferase